MECSGINNSAFHVYVLHVTQTAARCCKTTRLCLYYSGCPLLREIILASVSSRLCRRPLVLASQRDFRNLSLSLSLPPLSPSLSLFGLTAKSRRRFICKAHPSPRSSQGLCRTLRVDPWQKRERERKGKTFRDKFRVKRMKAKEGEEVNGFI